MSEFRIHHHVSELLALLGVRELDPLVYLLSKVVDDRQLRNQLATASNVTLAGITPEEKLKILREKQSKRTEKSAFEHGLVNHALCAAMRTLIKVAQNILSTGKYLNVIRQCGRDVRCPDAEEIIYTLREREYVDQIEKAYNYASKTLLNVLMDEKELMARLRYVIHS
ncbi:hypothetical protein QZH41_002165 [Actinostola sp. cb2023]|nr:hypothetical protein QZH41_002165 [Actinostola sp. cb2023]